jgi:hypothetical protein
MYPHDHRMKAHQDEVRQPTARQLAGANIRYAGERELISSGGQTHRTADHESP